MTVALERDTLCGGGSSEGVAEACGCTRLFPPGGLARGQENRDKPAEQEVTEEGDVPKMLPPTLGVLLPDTGSRQDPRSRPPVNSRQIGLCRPPAAAFCVAETCLCSATVGWLRGDNSGQGPPRERSGAPAAVGGYSVCACSTEAGGLLYTLMGSDQVFTQAAVAVATASRAVGGRALRGGEAAFRDAGRRLLVNGVTPWREPPPLPSSGHREVGYCQPAAAPPVELPAGSHSESEIGSQWAIRLHSLCLTGPVCSGSSSS
ncbi:unnamed protein product [Gadus morhua 'NCC']